MADRIKDWLLINEVQDVVDGVRKRLRAGEEGHGITLTLTADECTKVLACLKDPPQPSSRPRKDGIEKAANEAEIAMHYCRLVKDGAPPKNAVTDTMKHFDCSRSSVFEARRRVPSPNKS
jgi:hypothetical protein